FLQGTVTKADATLMAGELHNPLIERARITAFKDWNNGRVALIVPKVKLPRPEPSRAVNLEIPDAELARIGKEGIEDKDGTRRGPLALSLEELHAIRDYFRSKKRAPTDVELESLAQTWSEHCKHTIFNDPLDEIEEGIYKRYIRGATEKVRAKKGMKDFCVSVFKDNSGAISFNDDYLVTHKMETHNTPSALDPYGGAITGIVGVNRDALGFGLGAKPIANLYGFCVGEPSDTRPLYRDAAKTRPMLSPQRILEGVVKGIEAGGNQSGIPTPLGFVYADESYRGKPLVFAGTIGLIPRKSGGRLLHKKKARPGDYIVMAGGRVGADGIHGATFSSEALSADSPATAVQIGDAITQKKFSDAIVRELRDKNLYTSVTDNGAGGLSCSVAEMAEECGGAVVDLSTVPLKYPGLTPWQIWISESQERMTFSVPKDKWKEMKAILDKHGTEATVIGRFTNSGTCVVNYGGKKVMDIDLEFLHGGRPEKQLVTKKPTVAVRPLPARLPKIDKTLLSLLARPTIGSYDFISNQYDHEVQGLSVTKPLVGRGRVNADAAVIRPLATDTKGVVLSHGYAPSMSELDAYAMAGASIDIAIRNALAAGAPLDSLAILDNFCWSTSGAPERLYLLKEAARACYDYAVTYGTPYISGKDSMYNDFRGFDEKGNAVHVAVLPTLLISAMGVMDDYKKAMTFDFKTAGDRIYLIGKTRAEFGGSEFAKVAAGTFMSGRVPVTDAKENAS
ncbi:MAG TPA: AIR synthase-related protein, partial [Candidatus Paceibacterota bacterium]|nr:AIR synthase-related protein [Candidatus Paceibacterota bacterium]